VECSSGKICYHSNAAARRTARIAARARDVILNVYRCKECRQWHMTSNKQTKSYQTLRYLKMRHEEEWGP
jgi:hypothetical protein